MIGIEVQFVDNKGEIVDTCGPFFDQETYEEEAKDDCQAWILTKSGTVILNANKYFGDTLGYEFVDCLSMVECDTKDEVETIF